ncbi:hypothetical protein HU200_048834 [Digitaria exilis]|uniref:Uncharacterized protein n=1 Tax=Digitaria exilis TaxID=1010633 RepID=A0A835AUQ9_9POAL|nr:hypothetical protein HU200_048834 [Digitaria exilis]
MVQGVGLGRLKPWKRKVRELAYDAEDTIDMYLIRVSATPPPELSVSHRPWAAVLRAARRFKAARRIAGEIESIKNEVKEASERRQRFSIPDTGHPPAVSPATVDPRLHLRHENAARLVGLGAPTAELIRKLSLEEDARSQRLMVVAVVEAGGIGETTAVRSGESKTQCEVRSWHDTPAGEPR